MARARAGYAFLEMVFAVCLAAVLVGVAVNGAGSFRDVTRRMHARSDLDAVAAALRDYRGQNGSYPTTAQGLRALVIRPMIAPYPHKWEKTLERDIVPLDPWGNYYVYLCPGKRRPNAYDLFSCGPDGTPDTADDVIFW